MLLLQIALYDRPNFSVDSQLVLDKSHVVCTFYKTKIKYVRITANVQNHIVRFHPAEEEGRNRSGATGVSVALTGSAASTSNGQKTDWIS